MKQFFLRLRAAWNFSRMFPVIDNLPVDFWTKNDAIAHQTYLTSETGRKWVILMRRFVQAEAFKATSERVYSQYANGMASGTRAVISYNDALLPAISPASSESKQTNETPEEKELREILDQLSP